MEEMVRRVAPKAGVRVGRLAPIWLAGGLLLGASPARAVVVSPPYDVHACRAANWQEEGSLDRSFSGYLGNMGSSEMWVACPITLRASGPGVTEDAVNRVTVPVSALDGEVWCQLEYWSSLVAPDSLGHPANSWGWQGDVNLFSNTPTNSVDFEPYPFSPRSLWDVGSDQWLYATLMCRMQSGTAILNYTIQENGTDHNYRINSALSCSMDQSSNMMNYVDFAGYASDGSIPPGGFVRGQAGGSITNPPAPSTKFAMDCPVPQNRRIELALSRTAAAFPIGCNLDNTNLSTFQWPGTALPGGTMWPSQTLPASTSPFIAIPSTGQHNVTCGVNGSLGDPKLLSFRISPSPERSSWRVTASNPTNNTNPNAAATNALDDQAGTRWTTSAVGQSGYFYQVDFGSSKSWSQVTMDSATSNDYARGYRIDVSSNGQQWSTVGTGTGTSPFIVKKLSQQQSRYVRITLTTGLPNGSWWSLHELNIY